jgi:integrase
MKKVRRMRSPHSGVVLTPRSLPGGGTSWRARYRDPDTGKLVFVTLNSVALPTHAARRQWAIRKSQNLAKRRMAIAGGATLITRTPLSEAVEGYLVACENRLRKRTLEVYRDAANKFLSWTEESGIENLSELTAAKLTTFRESRIGTRKRSVKKGGGRGRRKNSTALRSVSSINIELRSIKTMLLQWRSEEKLPNVDREAISRCLKSLPIPREAPAYLSSGACRKLLESALRHDREVFKITREEHDGLRPIGSTRRYEPIAPFVIFLLLSGCRVGEALALRWSDTDLDALDADGRKVGEIRLRGSATKTKQWRVIGLEVCPSLHSLLATMRLKSGGEGYVFGGKAPLPHTRVEAARKRLLRVYGAPRFSWQNLRQTTGTYLTNAPGIYGAASVFMSAQQLGHSVAVAERHYLDVVRGIPREARTLEQAMQIEDITREVVDSVSSVGTDSEGYAHEKS